MFGRKAARIRELERDRDQWKEAAEYHAHDVKVLLGMVKPFTPPPPGNIWQIPTQGRRG